MATEETEFVVYDSPKSELNSGRKDSLYFEFLHGSNAGTRVEVPLVGVEDESVWDVMQSVSEGAVVTAVLEESPTERGWMPTMIEVVEEA